MDKKQITIFSFLVIITLGLAAGAIYLQQTHAVHVNAAVQTANAQRASAIKEMQQNESAATLEIKTRDVQITDLQGANTQLCQQLVKAKLTNPACH
jgi:predicted DNA-binding protein (UPF0251 family)